MRLLYGAMLAGVLAFTTGAAAEGPGNYAVRGTTGQSSGTYTGSATLAQTGREVWRLTWTIGSERYEGFGIGDGRVLSFMFTSSGRDGTALYVAQDDGSYLGRWAFRGDTGTGTETLTPRR